MALVPDEDGLGEQLWGYLRVFDADEDALMGSMGSMRPMGVVGIMGLLGNDNLLGGMLCHKGGDDTGDENHHDDTVEHVVVDEVLSWCHLHAHAYHDHGDGSGGVGRGKAEHHVTVGLG